MNAVELQEKETPRCTYAPELFETTKEAFVRAWPEYFGAEHADFDTLRTREYSRLDTTDQVYLDYTGGGLHADSQLRQHIELLSQNVFGNPHSNNPTSLAMTEHVERARAYVLEYFNASPDEYIAVFTPNASGALKLVGEAYPFADGGQYTLTFDNHNSVNGIREFARAKGASIHYIPVVPPELRINREVLNKCLTHADPNANNLFAFPAQSNFSGTKHPLELIEFARARGHDVLVDCAAFAPTNRLDIGKWQPDFAAFSFYKMFGYPTGLGCLLVRKTTLQRLRRPWFAGGTIQIASVQGDGHYLHVDEAAFEDGTVDYLNIPAIETGLRHLETVGIENVDGRVKALTGWLLDQLLDLHHDNGRPMLRLFGVPSTEMRGGTVTFCMFDVDGRAIDDRRVEELANVEHISIRTGCFCNPGAGEMAHGLTSAEMCHFFADDKPMSFSDLRDEMMTKFGRNVSAVRVSFGIASNFRDVYRLMAFLESFRNQSLTDIGEPEFIADNCRVIRDTA